jgi:SET domain-containing protein
VTGGAAAASVRHVLRVATRIGPSAIHGLGLFAAAPIPAGTVVWTFDAGLDVVLDERLVAELPPGARTHLDRYAYQDPVRRARVLCVDDARFFNHAAPANCGDSPVAGPDVTIALRDIAADEELTWDYAESGGEALQVGAAGTEVPA